MLTGVLIIVALTAIAVWLAATGEPDDASSAVPRATGGSGPAKPLAADDHRGTRSDTAFAGLQAQARVSDASNRCDAMREFWTWSEPHVLAAIDRGNTPPVVDQLAVSGNAEFLLAAALLRSSDDPAGIRRDVEEALALDPGHPLVLWKAADLCDRGQGGAYCSSPEFQGQVDAVLGGNGGYWMRRAAVLDEGGNDVGAREALRRATVAPDFDGYWADHVLLFERALSVAGGMTYAERALTAMGLAALANGLGYRIVDRCKSKAPGDGLWMNVCIDFAARLAADGRTAFDQLVGTDLLAGLQVTAGNEVQAMQAQVAHDALQSLVDQAADAELLLIADERFAARYVDELAANGDVAAREFAVTELERRRADPDFDACGAASERLRSP